MRYSGARRKLNHCKNLKSKISCQTPFKCLLIPSFRCISGSFLPGVNTVPEGWFPNSTEELRNGRKAKESWNILSRTGFVSGTILLRTNGDGLLFIIFSLPGFELTAQTAGRHLQQLISCEPSLRRSGLSTSSSSYTFLTSLASNNTMKTQFSFVKKERKLWKIWEWDFFWNYILTTWEIKNIFSVFFIFYFFIFSLVKNELPECACPWWGPEPCHTGPAYKQKVRNAKN